MSDEALNLENMENLPEIDNMPQVTEEEGAVEADVANEPEAAPESEEGSADNGEMNIDFEESVVSLFGKSIVEMVEKETFDKEALREAFIKALG